MAYGTYQARNPRARHNPLRSIPLFLPASTVFRPAAEPLPAGPATLPFTGGFAVAEPTPRDLAEGVLHVAENTRHGARLDYVRARAGIGLANRTSRPASKWDKAAAYTVEQVRHRKSVAFAALNRALARLRAADRQVAAAAAALAAI